MRRKSVSRRGRGRNGITCNEVSFKPGWFSCSKKNKQFMKIVVCKHLFLQENQHPLVLSKVDLGLENSQPALLEGVSSTS